VENKKSKMEIERVGVRLDLSERARPGFFSRRDFLVVGTGAALSCALPFGCGDDKGKAGGAGAGGAKPDVAAEGTPWDGTIRALDLMDALHLADLRHHGEFVDFGTAARFKYSLGGWMCGFGADVNMNGLSYTWASRSPTRLYFSLAEAKPLTFELRVKKAGVDWFSIYLNDAPLTKLTMASGDFEILRATSTIEQAKVGENLLKLVYGEHEHKVAGSPAAFAIDYLRIIAEGEAGADPFEPPRLDGLRRPHKVDDKEIESLLLPSPTTLSYYLDVPPGASLCVSAACIPPAGVQKPGPIGLKARVTPVDTMAATEIGSAAIAAGEWQDQMWSLGPVAGKLAKLDIEISGEKGSRIALGAPAIRIAPPSVQAVTRKPKNVIVLLVDTLRADKLNAYGKSYVRTPALDKFSSEATLFERCQSSSNWTKPACASVLTGLHPDSHKARGHSSRLAPSIKMAGEILQAAGFATGAFIANGYLASEFGFNRGWTLYTNYIRENKPSIAEKVYKEVLDFIKLQAQSGKPFFTYVQTIDPHVPYDPPAEDLKLYDAEPYTGPVAPRSTGELLESFKQKRVVLEPRDRRHLEALYDGEITYHDRHFGRFLDELVRNKLLDDTVFVLCSDHGEEFFEHESVGHGHTLFQELLHVPLVVRAPGVVPAGKRIKEDVGLCDVLPTVLAALGQPPAAGVEGRNLVPTANGAPVDPLCAAFSSFWSEADDRNLQWSVRKGDWKLKMKGPVNTLLYNLAEDPAEMADADERYPLALRALRISLGQFIGAPDKAAWASNEIAAQAAAKPDAAEDKAEEIPEDLKAQLRQLGYMQ
jgi:arylsulfatase A-like enzyme